MEIRFEKIASFEIRHDFFKSETLDWNKDWPESYTEENRRTNQPQELQSPTEIYSTKRYSSSPRRLDFKTKT